MSNPLSAQGGDVSSWSTITYVGACECDTCKWWWNGSAEQVAAARAAARRHAAANPGHSVRVETGKVTTYGEASPRG